MITLAIDIGGTKLTMAIFDGDRIVERESRVTDREGGRVWMLDQIASIGTGWKTRYRIDRCGIGFGGPVEFDKQRVALSTHVGGWSNFDLPAQVEKSLGVRPIMDNDANVGALGEAIFGAGRDYRPLFYMTLSTGIGGGIITSGESVYRGADSYAGEIGHLTIRPFRTHVLRAMAGARLRAAGHRAASRSGFRPALRGRLGARSQGRHHAAQSGEGHYRRRNQQCGRYAVRSAARGAAAPDHRLVARADRRGSRGTGR